MLHEGLDRTVNPVHRGTGLGLLGPASVYLQPTNFRPLPDRGLNHGAGRQAVVEQVTASDHNYVDRLRSQLLRQSCSRRCFLRRRFRESASFARRFSPGFM